MVYLAELLVITTDRLKIVRIHARNVHRVHGRKCLDDDEVSRLSFAPGKQQCCVLDALGCHPIETQKTRPGTTCACLAVASKQESCRDSMPSSL